MARMKFLCDADRCIECNGCVTACKNEHEVPWGVNRRRVVTLDDGQPGEKSISVACMHCTDAPCQAVCPVDCFYTTDDGIVLHDKNLCIGCGYCAVACPYQARTIGHGDDWYYGEETTQEAHVFHDERVGVANKCTFCVERIDEAKEEGMKARLAFDLTMTRADGQAWDFSLKAMRDEATKILLEEEPLMLVGSPPCTMWSILQNGNRWRYSDAEWQQKLDDAHVHIDLCLKVFELQRRAGRFFLYEHPRTATSSKLKGVRALMSCP